VEGGCVDNDDDGLPMTGVGGGEEGRDKAAAGIGDGVREGEAAVMESEVGSPGDTIASAMSASGVTGGSRSEAVKGGWGRTEEEEKEEGVQLRKGREAAEGKEEEGGTDESWIRGIDKMGDENTSMLVCSCSLAPQPRPDRSCSIDDPPAAACVGAENDTIFLSSFSPSLPCSSLSSISERRVWTAIVSGSLKRADRGDDRDRADKDLRSSGRQSGVSMRFLLTALYCFDLFVVIVLLVPLPLPRSQLLLLPSIVCNWSATTTVGWSSCCCC
jgi:hypothetical protein